MPDRLGIERGEEPKSAGIIREEDMPFGWLKALARCLKLRLWPIPKSPSAISERLLQKNT